MRTQCTYTTTTLPGMVTGEEKNKLSGNFTMGEIKEALDSIGSFKSLGPDGYHAIFYKQLWNELQHEVLTIFQEFHQTGHFSRKINHINIFLIPKQKNPLKL